MSAERGGAEPWHLRVRALFAAARLDGALDELQAELDGASDAGEPVEERVVLRLWQARALAGIGLHDAATKTLRAALSEANEAGDRELGAEVLEMMARSWGWRADPERAWRAFGEAAERYVAIDDVRGVLRCRLGVAESLAALGEQEEAREAIAPLFAEGATPSEPEEQGRAFSVLAALAADGERAAWLTQIEAMERGFIEAGAPDLLARAYLIVARSAPPSATDEVGIALYAEAERILRLMGNRSEAGAAAFDLARQLAAVGRLPEADRAIERAIEAASEGRDIEGLRHCLEAAVDIAVALEQPRLTSERLRSAATVAGELDDREEQLRLLALALDVANHSELPAAPALADELADLLDTRESMGQRTAWLRSCARAMEEAGRAGRGAVMLMDQATWETKQGRPELAASLWARAGELAGRAGDRGLAISAYEHAVAGGREHGHDELGAWEMALEVLRGD